MNVGGISYLDPRVIWHIALALYDIKSNVACGFIVGYFESTNEVVVTDGLTIKEKPADALSAGRLG